MLPTGKSLGSSRSNANDLDSKMRGIFPAAAFDDTAMRAMDLLQ
jgi:hypothetical protein